MPIINLNQMRQNESSRNFDDTVDANTLVSAENSQGAFGAFKFFTGIKAFFKGISALGTLTTTSRIPVTDANGNVSYTTVGEIKKSSQIPNNTNLDDFRSEGLYFVKDNTSAATITGKPSNVNFAFGLQVIKEKQDANGNICQMLYPEGSKDIYIRFYAGTWSSWDKLVTDKNNLIFAYEDWHNQDVHNCDNLPINSIAEFKADYNATTYPNISNLPSGIAGGFSIMTLPTGLAYKVQIFYGYGIIKKRFLTYQTGGVGWTEWTNL